MARAINAQPYLTLDRYRQLMYIPQCAFNGVENPDENVSHCDHYWQQWEREMVAIALSDAEEMLAQHLYFYLGDRFITETNIKWTDPLLLRWGHIIAGGIEGLTEITTVGSDFTVDPATITVATADFTSEDEIWIVDDVSELRIVPSAVETVGANYVVSIPQCRLIEWDNLEEQADPIDYDDTFPAATWLKEDDLTIYRRYTDDSEQAIIEFGHSCHCMYSGAACAGTQYDGCLYILNDEISKVRVSIADYDADEESWSCNYPTYCGCYSGDKIYSVKYRAGTTDVPGYERAIMRLAHTYMVAEPCGCTLFDESLKRDRNIPSILTAERINCPLGTMDGAWYAWQWLQNVASGRAYML